MQIVQPIEYFIFRYSAKGLLHVEDNNFIFFLKSNLCLFKGLCYLPQLVLEAASRIFTSAVTSLINVALIMSTFAHIDYT